MEISMASEKSKQEAIPESVPAKEDGGSNERIGRLLEAARDGNDLAFEELMRIYRVDVYRLARGMMGSADEASDVTQDVFIRFFRSLGRLDQARGVRAWLRRVTVNRCYDLLRARSREKRIDEQLLPGCMQPGDVSGDPDVARLILQCMDVLAPRERAAVVLLCQLGYSSVEAGETMGCSDATVRVLAHKARAKIKSLLMPPDNGWNVT